MFEEGSPPQREPRSGQRFRFYPGQSRCQNHGAGDRDAAASGFRNRPMSHGYMRMAATRRCERQSQPSCAGKNGVLFYRRGCVYDLGSSRCLQRILEIHSRSRRRNYCAGSIFPRVPVLHYKPCRARGPGETDDPFSPTWERLRPQSPRVPAPSC